MNNTAFWEALDTLITESEIVIDRPKGSRHPRHGFVYEIDYGYLSNTTSMDAGGIDVWRGSKAEHVCNAVICTVDLLKRDSEIKMLLGCTDSEIETILCFHNNSQYMKGILVRRPQAEI